MDILIRNSLLKLIETIYRIEEGFDPLDHDRDGIANYNDYYPFDPARPEDNDKDGLADSCTVESFGPDGNLCGFDPVLGGEMVFNIDSDDDNDGVLDREDAFPLDAQGVG